MGIHCFLNVKDICHIYFMDMGYFFKIIKGIWDTGTPTIPKQSLRHIIRVSNELDPDQDRRSVGPGLCTNCLQRLSKLTVYVHL